MSWLDDMNFDYNQVDSLPADYTYTPSYTPVDFMSSYAEPDYNGSTLMPGIDSSSYFQEAEAPQGQSYSQSYPDSNNNYGDSYYGGYAPEVTRGLSFEGIGNLADRAGQYLETPGGKFMAGFGGAGISAYGAWKQNKMREDALKKQKKMLAERQAKALAYDAPLRLSMSRQAVAPQQRGGESNWFAEGTNKLPSYYAEGGQPRPNENDPSVLGFIKYMMAKRKLPSEVREAGENEVMKTGVPNRYMTREEYLRRLEEQANSGNEPLGKPEGLARGGSNYVRGGTLGQADKIPAQLSDGEYIMDADVVSALGDGNNEAGAAKLDGMRKQIRTHKRAAPANKIPPKAKSPLAYMKKGAK